MNMFCLSLIKIKLILVQVMAWCRILSPYLDQWWPVHMYALLWTLDIWAYQPGGHYWDYYLGMLSVSQFTPTHLKPIDEIYRSLQWCHNELNGVSLLNLLFRHKSKKASKLPVTGLCKGNSPVTSEFPAQWASNAEKVSIWWYHHGTRTSDELQWLDYLRGCQDSSPNNGCQLTYLILGNISSLETAEYTTW